MRFGGVSAPWGHRPRGFTHPERLLSSMTSEAPDEKAWGGIAPGYDDLVTPINMVVAERALQRVGLRVGTRLLDVAAGSGALSIPAARAGAHVLATDLAPTMVERLQARARAAGLTNLQARAMDGTALDVDDGSFDLVASQHGVTLFPDMARGLQEMVRATRPGGKVMLVNFGPLQDTEFVNVFMRAVKAAVPGAPVPTPDAPPLPFQASDPAVLRQRLADAGLVDVQVQTFQEQATFASAEDYWRTLATSNPIGTALARQLSKEQRAQAMKALETLMAPRSDGKGGFRLVSAFNVGVGTKPA